MNEELKAKMLAYLGKLESVAEKASDFAAAEIPETVREYLRWLVVEHVAYALVGFVPMILWLCCLRVMNRWQDYGDEERKLDRWNSEHAFLSRATKYGGFFVAVLAIVFITGGQVLKATKVVVAPRVVILEEIAKLTGVKNK
jgi:hypothetical protein